MPSTEQLEWLKSHDLGLSYEQALHGVQTSLAMGFFDRSMEPKHARVGIDMSKSDMLALTCLLLDKGIFTREEYLEYIRLAANLEVKQREVQASDARGLQVSFR